MARSLAVVFPLRSWSSHPCVAKIRGTAKPSVPANPMLIFGFFIFTRDFKKSIMIGDSYRDYLAAKKTKIKFIGVGGLKIPGTISKKNLQSAIKFLFP